MARSGLELALNVRRDVGGAAERRLQQVVQAQRVELGEHLILAEKRVKQRFKSRRGGCARFALHLAQYLLFASAPCQASEMVRSHSGATTPGFSFVFACIATRSELGGKAWRRTRTQGEGAYHDHAEQAVVERDGAHQVVDAGVVGAAAARVEQVVVVERLGPAVFVARAARAAC